jgi:hypothetical protein
VALEAHPVSLLHGIVMILLKNWNCLPYVPLYYLEPLRMKTPVIEQQTPAMTVREVAESPAVDEKTIYCLSQQGRLLGFKVAGTRRFQLRDLQSWIDQQRAAFTKRRGKATGMVVVMTIAQIADHLNVTEQALYRLAGAKLILAFNGGESWAFAEADLDARIYKQSGRVAKVSGSWAS